MAIKAPTLLLNSKAIRELVFSSAFFFSERRKKPEWSTVNPQHSNVEVMAQLGNLKK